MSPVALGQLSLALGTDGLCLRGVCCSDGFGVHVGHGILGVPSALAPPPPPPPIPTQIFSAVITPTGAFPAVITPTEAFPAIVTPTGAIPAVIAPVLPPPAPTVVDPTVTIPTVPVTATVLGFPLMSIW